MSALICGSLAFDTIMVFHGHFREHILADKIHMLNVAFLVPKMRREFGGCAGNIAYNLKLLGETGYPMGVVGHDFEPYKQWMDQHAVSRKYLRELSDEFTAQAYITTDLEDNQITAFHPGAMNLSHENHVPSDAGIKIGIISPDGRDGMWQHAHEFADNNIPFIFDPGQGLPMFDGKELENFIELADWVAVNDYEAQLLMERTGLAPAELAQRVRGFFVTRGGEGSHVYVEGHRRDISAAPVSSVADPTGCGDAYRAGLLFGLMRDLPIETTANIASLMGAMKIECHGTQNHTFTMDVFRERYKTSFSTELTL